MSEFAIFLFLDANLLCSNGKVEGIDQGLFFESFLFISYVFVS